MILGAFFRWFCRFFSRVCTALGLVLVIAGVGFFFVSRFKSAAIVKEKTVLSLSLDGPFVESSCISPLQALLEGGAGHSFYRLLATFKKAENDPKILGISVHLGTPYLGLAQIQELRDAFSSFRSRGKFIYFYAQTFGEMTPASSAYYLATAADVIGIQPLGSVGLTGLGVELPFVRKTLDAAGVKADFIRHGKYKSYTETFTEEKMSPAFRESMEGIFASLSQQVVKGISSGRKLCEQRVQELIKLGPFSDQEALKNALVDKLAYWAAFEKAALKRGGEKASLMPFGAYQKIVLSQEKSKKSTASQIALVFAQGMIVPDRAGGGPLVPSSPQETIGDASTLEVFKEIEENPLIKAVVYRIDSGGGHALASDAIGEGLRKLKEAGKKVVVSMGNTAASGGYLIALAADEIIANPGTITGSIGVFWGKFVLSGLWEKLGVYWDVVDTSENARLSSMNTPFSEEARLKLQAWVDALYGVFIQRTAKGRRMSIDEARRVAEGRVWTGEQAHQYRLVDHLGGVSKALERVKVLAALPDHSSLVIYPRSKSFWELLFHSFSGEGPGFLTVIGVGVKRVLWHDLFSLFSSSPGSARFQGNVLTVW